MFIRFRTRVLRALLYFLIGSLFFIIILYNLNGIHENLPLYDHQIYEGSDNSNDTEIDELALYKIVKIEKDKNKKANGFQRAELGVCKVPKLEINGSEVFKFYKKVSPLNCQKGRPKHWVYIDKQRRVQPTDYAKREIGLKNINCVWTFYDRINDHQLKWTTEEKFVFGQIISKGDYVKITCTAGWKKWSNPFMVVVPQEQRVKELHAKRNKAINTDSNSQPPLNVYILSFDSLSQMSFRRNLPKTVKYLEDELKSVVFNGYNIVGDGTPQAFIPILTAQTEEELPLTRKRYANANYVDDVYPFIWHNFSDRGYATLYGEDGHNFGTFTYRLKGFRNKPTDHYPITFFHYSESIQSSKLCIGSEKQHDIWFRYIESFWREYSKVGLLRFSLMHHSCLSHDDINLVQQADDDIVYHLKEMKQMGAFDNTLVIVMADHGSRFSEIRQTQQGQLEERLPFFSVSLHENRTSEGQHIALENLRKNALDRLATPFDVHAMLMDALRWPLSVDDLRLPNEIVANIHNKQTINKNVPPSHRSLSLFREIPADRTCDQADVEPHWCTCLAWNTVTDTSETIFLAKAVVKLINDYTKPERKICAPLKLKDVEKAKKLVPNNNLLKYSGVLDKDGFVPEFKGDIKVAFATYQLIFVTTPGNAKYEVTLFYDGKQISVDWSEISHINKYGDVPHCIIDKNYFMATYCVCYDKIGINNEEKI